MDEPIINKSQYQEGILYSCKHLLNSFIRFLKDEGRYKFRMISYMNEATSLFNEMENSISEEEKEIYGRVFYNYNKLIVRDFEKLRKRRLTPADSIICLMRQLLSILKNPSEMIRFTKLRDRLTELFQQFYDNIRNRHKSILFHKTELFIRDLINTGKWGPICKRKLDLYEIENPSQKIKTLEEEVQPWSIIKGKEVTFEEI